MLLVYSWNQRLVQIIKKSWSLSNTVRGFDFLVPDAHISARDGDVRKI